MITIDGAELKRVRENKGWSQRFLAAVLEISQAYINKMENGSKPLNIRAIQFLERENNVKTNTYLRTPKKQVKKGVKKALKLKPLRNHKRPDFVQNGKVSDFSDFWWKKKHPLCKKCKKSCKQSIRVMIISCPQFEGR